MKLIKNGDLPAMPIELNGFGLYAPESYLGLTKREMFAMAAMQGILSNGVDYTMYGDQDICKDAVIHADNLLAELEKTK
jgi:hypothetical protein